MLQAYFSYAGVSLQHCANVFVVSAIVAGLQKLIRHH